MRFAQITTVVAAILMAPLAVAVAGPQMGDREFISAARCAAYEGQIEGSSPSLIAAQNRLNLEASRQAAETVAAAQTELRAIYASEADEAELRQEHARACGQASALFANRTLAPGEV
jgi:hypothetical protein